MRLLIKGEAVSSSSSSLFKDSIVCKIQMIMSSFSKRASYDHELSLVFIVGGFLIIFALLFLLPITDAVKVGSKQPKCEGKCLNCTPCTPTLIAPIHQAKQDYGYYLLAWKCKCGNKLFHP
uniref:Epidermal patterning factor-like protein n=1 Tax=Nicotiana tabacum TaxID=4097 RepID=A0A1S3ZCS5_TOBAC|nr:PREDICTED: uncharacterized protein LOC107785430 [Nicotiana tabacum]